MANTYHALDAVGSLEVPGLWVGGNLEGVAQGRDALCTFFLVLLP